MTLVQNVSSKPELLNFGYLTKNASQRLKQEEIRSRSMDFFDILVQTEFE